MPLAKTIADRGSCVCWSPYSERRELLALGTKEGIGANGFDDYGGRLEIYDLDFSGGADKAPKLLATIETKQRFGSIAWGPHGKLKGGIICGGMTDGTVKLWDAQKLIDGSPDAHIVDCKTHDRCVQALEFNPHPNMSHILATGGADNQVYIIDLSNPTTPNPVLPATMERAGQWHNAAVNTLAWNPQVAHILASAADDGTCIVWDLKNNKTFCTLQQPLRLRYSDIAWNPNEGFQIITAIADDSKPLLQVWDLRKSTTAPFKELQGHTRAVLNIAWNKNDTNILASCGEDGKTLIWDLFLGQPISEVETPKSENSSEQQQAPERPQESMSANDLFSFGDSTPRALTGEGDRRNNSVAWATHVPGVLACCTFDKRVNVFSLHGIGGQKPPKYMRRPAGASFGFGGRYASFGCPEKGQASQVALNSHTSDSATVVRAKKYLETAAQTPLREICLAKAADESLSESTRQVWSFMALFFSDGSPTYDARQYLQKLLGYEKAEIAELLASATGKPSPKTAERAAAEAQAAAAAAIAAEPVPAPEPEPEPDSTVSAEDFFGSAPAAASGPASAASSVPASPAVDVVAESSPPPSTAYKGSSTVPQVVEGPGDDKLLLQALLVGNFEGVVDLCLTHGRMSDALMFAFASTQEDLWQRAQDAYLAQQSKIRSHTLRVVSAVVKTDFSELVATSEPDHWRETLTVLVTFSKKDDFQRLSEQLGDHLAKNNAYQHAAGLCYLCASNASKTLRIWQKEMAQVASVHGKNAALQELIERIHVFGSAPENNAQAFGAALGDTFTAYANFLADDGELSTATQYLRILPQCRESQELQQRLAQALVKAPARPQQQQQQQPRQQQPSTQNYQQRSQPVAQQQRQPHYGAGTQPYQSQPQHSQPQIQQRQAQPRQQPQHQSPAQQRGGYYNAQPAASHGSPYGQPQGQPQPAPGQYQSNHQPAPTHSYGSPAPQHSFASQQPTTFNPAAHVSAPAPAPAPQRQAQPRAAPMYSNPYESGAYQHVAKQQQQQQQQQQQHQQQQQQRQTQPAVQTTHQTGHAQPAGSQRNLAAQRAPGRPTAGKHMPDGFGSTHAAARNYVEQATAAQVQSPPAAAPVPEAGTITNSLQIIISRLKASNLRPSQQRQIISIDAGVDILIKSLNSGQLQDRDVVQALVSLCASFDSDDFNSAARQTAGMVRNYWKEHKDWLKGFKYLSTLCKTHFAN